MNRSRNAFTLIEMLVVISVIAILAGLSFKMVQIAKRNADRAKTIAILERVSFALNEYKAEYGIYPPVNKVGYEYENVNYQSEWFANSFLAAATNANSTKLFEMGLVAHLYERERASIKTKQADAWVPDKPRDVVAKRRWNHFIDDLTYTRTNERNKDAMIYANNVDTIRDAWRQEIRYECDPPYLAYRLWSLGPPGESQPIHKDRWDN